MFGDIKAAMKKAEEMEKKVAEMDKKLDEILAILKKKETA